MKHFFLLSALALAASAQATEVAGGPRVTGLFRIVKQDGTTVVAQAPITTGTTGELSVINVSDKDAFLTSNGRCAFNVKYDEASSTAAEGTTNRLYDNDALIAQNTNIALQAGVLKTIWTQPYLKPGANNIRIVVNADSSAVSLGWVRVVVSGACGAVTAPPAPPSAPASAPKTGAGDKPTGSGDKSTTGTGTGTGDKPTTGTGDKSGNTPPPAVSYQPGSTQWNNLHNAWGYSNYAVTQLKGKGYARYDDLARLNAALAKVMAGDTVTQSLYNELMAAWSGFLNDADFKAAMAAVTPPKPGSGDKPTTGTGTGTGDKPTTGTGDKSGNTPPPAVSYQPGSTQWNNLHNAWGYSNYAVTQLKGAGYARYDDLARLNAALAEVMAAGTVTQAQYDELMAAWSGFLNDADFKAAMAAITPKSDRK